MDGELGQAGAAGHLANLGRMWNMHLKQNGLRWIEKRLSPSEQRQAQAHLAQCAKCDAELSEMQDLVGALEAIPAALSALPWHKERLWPAIWAALAARPAALRPSHWARWVSTASLLVVFCGVWWGSTFYVVPVATTQASYIAQPPATPHLPVTPPQAEPAGNSLPRPAKASGTPQPLPAPVQTPIFAGKVLTGTVAPGE
jgi:hypothetical protein